MTPEDKVRENRARRMAERQNARLSRSRRRDTLAADYGTYRILWLGRGQVDEFVSLTAAIEWLEKGEGPFPGKTVRAATSPRTASNEPPAGSTTTTAFGRWT